ncbi:MAG: ABC transporter ATP-binding protein [Alphaproteobacteria bacterium]|nr:ABC transporter ATP-binding protein [Alphaproteobacteria bacterium]
MTVVDYAIDVRGLTKSFNHKVVVDRVSLRVPRGKIYGFLGPNGSGKTTTIRMICGLLTPDAGEGTCLGLDLRKESHKIRNRVGYMTQKFSYWDDLSIRENLAFVVDMFGLDHKDERVDQTLRKLNLTSRAAQLAGELSGGWKQRLALAACTMHEPDLLLLDEPTAGVDPKARREFWDEIHRLAGEGLTVLVSTHYMDEAERCHAIIYISYGHIVAEGTVAEVVRQAGLTTWIVRGPRLIEVMRALEKNPYVTTIAAFGDSLHISGTDADALAAAISPYQSNKDYIWQKAMPELEDAFIHFMARMPDAGGKT